MGRKKRRWRRWKARKGLVNPSLGRLVAWAEWEEGGETDAKENACPDQEQAT